jgi:hypothetical protein
MKTILKWINLAIPFVVIFILCFIVFILLKIDFNTTEELIIGLATLLLAIVPFSYYLFQNQKLNIRLLLNVTGDLIK